MHSMIVKILSISLPIFVSASAYGYIGQKHCQPADSKATLYKHASELDASERELKEHGDHVVYVFGHTPDVLRQYYGQKYIFWGPMTSTYAIEPGSPGEPVMLSQVISSLKSAVMADLRQMQIETSMFENWQNLLNRILGHGDFDGKGLVNQSDYHEICDREGNL